VSNVDWPTAAARLLCPPGEGVYAFGVGERLRRRVQENLYGDANPRAAWEASLATLADGAPRCALLGIASDTGGGVQRGANWGPLFLRDLLLSQGPLPAFDLGDVRVIPHLLDDRYLNVETIARCRKALYDDPDVALPVSPLSIAAAVAEAFVARFPAVSLFTIGGDHSASYPVVHAWLADRAARGVRAGLVHFDAHTDLMNHRLGIDLNFATWVRRVLPALGSPSRLVQLGIRCGEMDRSAWEARIGHRQFWSAEIQARGPSAVAAEVLAHFRGEKVEELYVSFDIDVLDETCAGATGTPEPGGLLTGEALELLAALSRDIPVTGADLMEIAPQVRFAHLHQPEPDTTLHAAAAVARSLIAGMSSGRA
jgi:agmatinase